MILYMLGAIVFFYILYMFFIIFVAPVLMLFGGIIWGIVNLIKDNSETIVTFFNKVVDSTLKALNNGITYITNIFKRKKES